MQDIVKESTKQKSTQADRENNRDKEGAENDNKKTLISWSTAEYETNAQYGAGRSVSWYWISLMAASLLTVFALWQNNVLFAIFVIVAWLTIVSLSGIAPKIWAFAVSEKGVTIGGDREYLWEDIVGFDIHKGEGAYSALLLKTRHAFEPMVRINIPKEKEKEITDVLLRFAHKEEYEDSLIDVMMRIMRF